MGCNNLQQQICIWPTSSAEVKVTSSFPHQHHPAFEVQAAPTGKLKTRRIARRSVVQRHPTQYSIHKRVINSYLPHLTERVVRRSLAERDVHDWGAIRLDAFVPSVANLRCSFELKDCLPNAEVEGGFRSPPWLC